MQRLAGVFGLLSLVWIAPLARAQAPSTMSYQGVLTDAAGVIVADGPYNLTFRVYDVAASGVALWTESHAAVPVVRGGFSVVLGTTTPLTLAFDKRYWLGVQVFAEAELTPRVELASSPYALSLRLPFSQTLSSTSPLLVLDNADPSAADAVFKGRVDFGSTTSSGDLRLFRSGAVGTTGRFYTSANGANLDLFDEGAGYLAAIQSDANGQGGFVTVYRDVGATGFQVDGNRNGTHEPHVSVVGSARSCVFDMGQTGNASVALPADALSASEMFDEAGVAGSTLDGLFNVGPSVIAYAEPTIVCPSSGYVVAIATLQASANHSAGTTSNCRFGVSASSTTFPTIQDHTIRLPSSLPSGAYDHVVTLHGIFPVTAGFHSFYLLAQELSGTWTVDDEIMTLMFFPTAYGVVDPMIAGMVTGNDGVFSTDSPNAAEIARKRNESRAVNDARVQRELEEMRARLTDLERQLRQTASEQAVSTAAAPR